MSESEQQSGRGKNKPLKAPRGTRDVISPEVERWQDVERSAHDTFGRYGFREMRTPIFEDSAVFEKGTIETLQSAQKEMYRFVDLGGHELTLRPEGTPPVIRAYVEHNLGHSKDLDRFYYIGPMFRYERPQRGRYRQFHQIGVEVFGSESAALDAEVIDMAMTWLGDLGLRSLQLCVNSVGDHDDRPAYMEKLIEAQRSVLGEMSENSRRRHEANPLRVFDSKDPQDQLLIEKFPTILDHLRSQNRAHFDEVCAYLSDWGIDYSVEPRLVRGLDYYRRTVFEVTSSVLGAQDALLGGGRYDGLVGQMGGDDIPGVGFAAGLERIVLALPEGAGAGPIDCYVVTVSPDLIPQAMKVMRDLRSHGLCCTTDFQGRSMKAQMKAANRSNAPATVIFGPDELSKGFCTLKMMESGEQREVSLELLVKDLQRIVHMGNLGN